MIESTLVREWKDAARAEGRLENAGAYLVRVVKGKYKNVADDVAARIRGCRDLGELDRWLDVALMVDTLEEFRQQTGL